MTESRPAPFAGCLTPESRPLVFAGLPDDSKSSYLRGTAAGPAAIRRAYDGRCYSACSEGGVDLACAVTDGGDLAPYEEAEARVAAWLGEGRTPFFAGGDHAVTVPVMRGFAALGRPIHVVHLDAHPDLYDEYEGDRFSHACVMARLLEMEHVASLTQLGLRTWNASQRAVAARHAGKHAEGEGGLARIGAEDAVFLTIDLDGIDPAFAPGVAHPVPGGWTSREAIELVKRTPGTLVGMDVVELLPGRDVNDATAVVAGRLLIEGMARAV